MSKGKYIECKGPLLSVLEDAGSSIEELRDEITEWRDNLSSGNMEHLPKYEEVSECADTLESAEAEAVLSKLVDALTDASEGAPFKAGCPPHVFGKPCKRCKWHGRPGSARTIPPLTIHDPPRRQAGWRPGDVRLLCAEYRDGCSTGIWSLDYKAGEELPSPEQLQALIASEHEQARRHWWAEAEKIDRSNERALTPPDRIPDSPEVPPNAELQALLAKELSWKEFRKYGRKSLSRADRLGNALTPLRLALEELGAAVEGNDADWAQEIGDLIDEASSALEEIEGVDFPGMF